MSSFHNASVMNPELLQLNVAIERPHQQIGSFDLKEAESGGGIGFRHTAHARSPGRACRQRNQLCAWAAAAVPGSAAFILDDNPDSSGSSALLSQTATRLPAGSGATVQEERAGVLERMKNL